MDAGDNDRTKTQLSNNAGLRIIRPPNLCRKALSFADEPF